jgi:hypothetical protein
MTTVRYELVHNVACCGRTLRFMTRCVDHASMTTPPLDGGWLPPGRWVCTEEEAKAVYVDGQPGDREDIWLEWQQVTSAVRDVVGEVAACWLSGSFFTDKPDPRDIDCVYIIDSTRLIDAAASDPRHAMFLYQVATSQLKDVHGVRVDSYVLEWMPTPGAEMPEEAKEYLGWRGYWDDLWCRIRDEDARLDSIPRRGYLEVYLDGYK